MWDGIPKIKIHCCITIEARADEEMNETALGTCSSDFGSFRLVWHVMGLYCLCALQYAPVVRCIVR